MTVVDTVIEAPPSKAHSLRTLFIAGLAEGRSKLKNLLLGEDQLHAINCLKELGIKIELKGNNAVVEGSSGKLKTSSKLFVGNSGLTARFLTALACLAEGKTTINGSKRMQERPMKELIKALNELGTEVKAVKGNCCLPVEVEGKLVGGKVKLNAEKSSQFLSALLIAAPYAEKDVGIELVGEMKSRPYVDITIQCMKDFGVKVKNQGYRKFFVKASQRYKGRTYEIEGDYSSASYWFAAAAITGEKIKVTNLKKDSLQGDKKFLEVLEKMGCKVVKGKDFVEVQEKKLKPIEVDLSDCPDLVPSLAVVAAFAEGKTKIKNVEHLRLKESDRLKAIALNLQRIGCKVVEGKDFLEIKGNQAGLHSAEIECFDDHRIAMAFAVAGLKVKGIQVKDKECVKKSYPNFFEELNKRDSKNVVLIGFRGTGKTIIGKKLAENLGKKFLDLDELIWQREGKTISEIFEEKGEKGFRKAEKRVLEDACMERNAVISCGGGAVLDKENRKNLKDSGTIILLEASPKTIFQRIAKSNRPALTKLGKKEEIIHLLAERKPFYEELAEFKVKTDSEVKKAVKEIMDYLKEKNEEDKSQNK